jgi:AraC family transcriptional regulator of adaptative response / DNA-3-methyladenine glycosylase II
VAAAYDAAMPAASARATESRDTGRLYAAMLARDARFDGRFFVGVTSTGVYCRPVCRVRTPLQRNCRFFAHAAGAEAAGFRPCLRCRPELAPGLALIDSPQALAQHAARQIEQAACEGRELYMPQVAERLGVTDRHLRRIFGEAFGVSPLEYLNTRRLLQAKQLLTDTALSVTAVAHASGFGSLRRFNAAFAEHYRLSPSDLRKQREAAPAGPHEGAVTVRLGYRPPYDIAGMLRFFADRAVPGLECVEGLALVRSLSLTVGDQRLQGWTHARFAPERHELHVTLSAGLVPALTLALQRHRQAFDLDADPALIDPVLAALPAPPCEGLRLPGSLDGFETAVRVILGQQVTVSPARTLVKRLVQAFGEPVQTPHARVNLLFPGARALAHAEPEAIGRLGIVRQRVGAIQALARAVEEDRLALHPGAPLAPTLDSLRALPGVGEWTAQLIAMRALAWPDAFPSTDIGLLNALGTRDVKSVEMQAEAWRPWRAYAVIRLWQLLETRDG